MSNVLTAIAILNDALTLATNVGAALKMVENEGRDLTDTELNEIRDARLAAIDDLDAEIARRRRLDPG